MAMYFLPDGRPTRWPTSKELAKRKRTVKYNDGVLCSDCNDCSIKFTSNDKCLYCARMMSQHLLNLALGVAHVDVDFVEQPVIHLNAAGWRTEEHEDTVTWEQAETLIKALHSLGFSGTFEKPLNRADRVPVSVSECLEWGAPYWVKMDPCARHGHFGIRTPDNECAECLQAAVAKKAPAPEPKPLSPRQQAIKSGATWYEPNNPCRICGELEERRVDNGQCRCTYHRRAAKRPPSARQSAITAGEKWYGPKDACKSCNEKAPRRVDNGQCWCRYPTGRQAAEEARQLMQEAPDFEITREDAQAVGLRAFRQAGRWGYVISGHPVE